MKKKLLLSELNVTSFVTVSQAKGIIGGKGENTELLAMTGLTQCEAPGGCLGASNPLACNSTSCNGFTYPDCRGTHDATTKGC